MYLKHKQTGDCVRIDNLNDWEVVPETVNPPDRWQDVTVDCEWMTRQRLEPGGENHPETYLGHGQWQRIDDNPNYRLRKVQFARQQPTLDEAKYTEYVWAFIVERKART